MKRRAWLLAALVLLVCAAWLMRRGKVTRVEEL